MSYVQRLPDELINQIAAGEVVERPASVVKELVENSLDAGATRIRVDMDQGGLSLLRIADNGMGMDETDARLAVERHATSKLREIDDLQALTTYGFRGEALASVASVSRFTLRTRRREDEQGVELFIEGGALPVLKPCGIAPGTVIEVRDLFYNVPARRKFLKSSTTESGHVADFIEAVALSAPSLALTLVREGRVAREWLRAEDRASRVRAAFPSEPLAELRGEREGVRLEAYLARPERARAASNTLRLFLNGRLIRDRLLLRTVSQAYGSVLPSGRYPVGVLFLELPPDQVDVNVHPQKAEVRFLDGKRVGDQVFSILSLELGRAFGIAPASRFSWPSTPSPPVISESIWGPLNPSSSGEPLGGTSRSAQLTPSPATQPMTQRVPVQGSLADVPSDESARSASPSPAWLTPIPPAQRYSDADTEKDPRAPLSMEPDPWGLSPAAPSPSSAAQPATQEHHSTYPTPLVHRSPTAPTAVSMPAVMVPGRHGTPVTTPITLVPAAGGLGFSQLRFLAQARQMFLICESDQGLVVIDQHAAAERVTFHRLKRGFASASIAMQPLLLPFVLDVPPDHLEFAERFHEELLKMGVDLRPSGPRTLTVHALPQILKHHNPERVSRDLLAEVTRESGRAFSDAIDLVLATMACHGSVRAGDPMQPEEAQALLRALDEVDFAGHCPHGRPVVTLTRWEELERKVGR